MSDTTINSVPEASVIPDTSVENPQQETMDPVTKPAQLEHENVGNAADGYPEKKEHTRSRMAILFVLGFFAILFLCFVYAIMVDATLGDLKDTLVGVIGALSGILGFIVGYYYKTSQEQ